MQKSNQMKTSKIDFTLFVKNKVDTLTRCFQNFNATPLKMQIIPFRDNFSNFRPKNGWKYHKTHNRPLSWQQMSRRLNLSILFMCTQRPFTSQVISKIYFLTFASYIEKLPETTIKWSRGVPMDPKMSFRALAQKRKVIGRRPFLTLSNFTLRFFWWQKICIDHAQVLLISIN